MAGDWIKFETATFDKPEVVAMADILDLSEQHVVGCLMWVWAWFDQHTTNGDTTAFSGNGASVTKTFLDRRVSVPGFADAMEKTGWLVVNDTGLTLPNFDRHNGKTAKTRALTAKRVAKHKGNGKVTPSALPREEKSIKNISKGIPPKIEDVAAYCRERGNNVDPQSFIDYYAASGWMRGKNKIKDWKACVRTWEKRHEESRRSGRNGAAQRNSDLHDYLDAKIQGTT